MGELLDIATEDGVRVATLHHGRGNALDPPTLAAICALFELRPALPTVLAARGRSFCTGLDLDHALACDRDGMRALILGFHDAVVACLSAPAPVVAAIGGHALAGGALLSAACDRRIMARGSGRWGIHGAQLGIAYPTVAVEVLRLQYGRAATEEILHGGRLSSAEEAFAAGRVEELVEPGDLLPRSLAWAREWTGPRGEVFAAMKNLRRRTLQGELARARAEGEPLWLDRWFHPDTQAAIRAARSHSRKDGA